MRMIFQDTCSDLIRGAWCRQILHLAFRTGQKVWLPRQTGMTHTCLQLSKGPALGVSLSPHPCFFSVCLMFSGLPGFQAPWETVAEIIWRWIITHLTAPAKAGTAREWILEFQDPSSQLISRDGFRAASSSKASDQSCLLRRDECSESGPKPALIRMLMTFCGECYSLGLGESWQLKKKTTQCQHQRIVAFYGCKGL